LFLCAGVVSTFVYYPRKKKRKSVKIIPKIDEPLDFKQALRYRIVAARVPGMAFDDAFDDEPDALGTAVLLHRFEPVFRAVRMKPAALP
jgi:hypothetical protein